MSRSGYSEDCEQWSLIRWRGAVASAARGKRGQAVLQEMAAALDALEAKRLISGDLVRDGEVCALGALGVKRGLDMTDVDPEDSDTMAGVFGIARALACEIMFINDEWYYGSPEVRFAAVRKWVAKQIKATP